MVSSGSRDLRSAAATTATAGATRLAPREAAMVARASSAEMAAGSVRRP